MANKFKNNKYKVLFILILIFLIALVVSMLSAKIYLNRVKESSGNIIVDKLQVKDSLFEKEYIIFIKEDDIYNNLGVYSVKGLSLQYKGVWVSRIKDIESLDSYKNFSDEDFYNIEERRVDTNSKAYKERSRKSVEPADFEIPPIIYVGQNSLEVNGNNYYIYMDYKEGNSVNYLTKNKNIITLNKDIGTTNLYYSNFSQNNLALEGYLKDQQITWCLFSLENTNLIDCYDNVPFGYTILSPNGKDIIIIGTNHIDSINKSNLVYEGKVYVYNLESKQISATYEVPKNYLDVSYIFSSSNDLIFREFDGEKVVDVLTLDY
jgi:hypothetical protein